MEKYQNLFIEYLKNNGIVLKNQEGVIKRSISQYYNTKNEKEALLNSVKDYFVKIIQKYQNIREFSRNFYSFYLKADDKFIMKAVRRLFIVKIHTNKMRMIKFFNKWNHNIKFLSNEKSCSTLEKNYSTNKNNIPRSNKHSIESSKNQLQKQTTTKCSNRISNENSLQNLLNNEIEVFDKLYLDSIVKSEQLKSYNEQKLKKEIKDCTFQPKLKRNSSFSNIRSNFNDRQKLKIEFKSKNIELLSREQERRLNIECTFQPKINDNYYLSNKEILENFNERMRKFEETHQKKLKILEEEKFNTIGINHSKTQSSKYISTNCYEEKRNKDKKTKIKELTEKFYQEVGITFKPKLDEKKLRRVKSSLIERNDEFLLSRERKIKSFITKDDMECTFTPNILESRIKVIQFESNTNKNSKLKSKELNPSYKGTKKNKSVSEISKKIISKGIKSQIKFPNVNLETEFSKKNIDNSSVQSKQSNLKKLNIESHFTNNQINLKNNEFNTQETFRDNEKIETLVYSEMVKEESKSKELKCDNIVNIQISQRSPIRNTLLIQSLNDQQLLELANNYITTDESLERIDRTNNYNNNIDPDKKDEIKMKVKVNKIKDRLKHSKITTNR